jgi:hypothetical protein
VGELGGEGDVGEGDIIEDEVELGSPTVQVLSNETRYLFVPQAPKMSFSNVHAIKGSLERLLTDSRMVMI